MPPSDRGRGQHRRWRGGSPPDILYHATNESRARRARDAGVLALDGRRPVFLSRTEGQAWQVAHRSPGVPAVLYIDVSRARRAGCRFERNRQGLWQVASVPARNVLNLCDGFAEQVSAGGVPVFVGPDGPEVCLIKVKRRHSGTWEVAKGKLEPGEQPRQTAVREVHEEMGYGAPLVATESLGFIRYGFHTPDGSPRLKTLHMYLMHTPERFVDFTPADREGVIDVGWFDPRTAERSVTHRSLRPLMRQVRRLLEQDPRRTLRHLDEAAAPVAVADDPACEAGNTSAPPNAAR